MYLKSPSEKRYSPQAQAGLESRPSENLGFISFPACLLQAMKIDLAKAIRFNRVYRRQLWSSQAIQVERLLGFTTKPDENSFALRMAWWQCSQGIKPADGVLGPTTWRKLRPQLTARTAYDRKAALDYAHRHWNIPCNDQFIALSGAGGKDFIRVEAGTRFVHEFDRSGAALPREHALRPDGTRIKWEDLDDCTHFISSCIGQPPGDTGGGIPLYRQLGSPPQAPYGIVRVSSMVDWLLGRHKLRSTRRVQIIGTEKSNDDRLIGRLEAGDLIAYWNKRLRNYSHLTLYLGGDKIGCHTYCRFDDPGCTWDNRWDLGRGTHLWTFLHFTT
jgi:hypothetical protein